MDYEDTENDQHGPVISSQERNRIEKRGLEFTDDFYVAETSQEREARLESLSATDLHQIRHEVSQALRKQRGVSFANNLWNSDWFQNKIPESSEQWEFGHGAAFEMKACITPIIISKRSIKMEIFQDRMQKRGAFLIRIEETEEEKFFILTFLLESSFYCEVKAKYEKEIPEQVLKIFKEDRERKDAGLKSTEALSSREVRINIIRQREERNIRNNGVEDVDSDEEDKRERIIEEEENAKKALFKLSGFSMYILSYRIYFEDD